MSSIDYVLKFELELFEMTYKALGSKPLSAKGGDDSTTQLINMWKAIRSGPCCNESSVRVALLLFREVYLLTLRFGRFHFGFTQSWMTHQER